MQITFLVGNGFDLNLGLKTSFSDFLVEYRKIKDGDSSVIRHFKEEFLKDTKLWSNAELAFGQSTSQFWLKAYNADDFYLCYEDFCTALAQYLSEEEEKINFDAIKDIVANKFSQALVNYLQSFRERQQQEIKNAIATVGGGTSFRFISFNYTQTLDKCIATLKRHPGILGSRMYRNGSYSNEIQDPIHVHGYTDKNMVLGVNDTSQIDEPDLFEGYGAEYVDQLIKIKANEMNEENTDSKAHQVLKSSDLIYVYGMSLGDTDMLWWQRICEIMKEKTNVHLLLHCYDVPQDTRLAITFQKYAKQKKAEFLRFCQFDYTVKEDIAKRIHIGRNNLFANLDKMVEWKENIPQAVIDLYTSV